MKVTARTKIYWFFSVVLACFAIAFVVGHRNNLAELQWLIMGNAVAVLFLIWASYVTEHDQRARGKTEAALQEANARLQGVLDGATQVAIIATDVEGFITVFNTGAQRMLGYPVQEVIGRLTLESLHLPEEINQRGAQLSHALETAVCGFDVLVEQVRRDGHEVREWTYVRKDGSLFVVTLAVTAIRDAAGQISGFLAVASDISDRKQAEANLRQAMEAAEVATRAKSDFLATMSHEIRTPMNGVIGMTRLLMSTPLNDAQREYAETIRSSGDALLAIINDVLDFSKIEAGKLELDIIDFELPALLDGVAELFAEAATRKGIDMRLAIAPEVPVFLRGDAGRMRQILTNLISNAVKFTERGQVTISVTRQLRSLGAIVLRFEIADTGVGLQREAREWLFKAFSQGDPTTTRKYGGTGLGLAISSRLVHIMGGDIGVESDLGRGSTFWFTVHVERAPRPEIKMSTDATPRSAAGAGMQGNEPALRGHILIAEDNLTNQRVATYMLSKLGYTSETVASGQAAIDAVTRCHYDAILMDCHMPGMDGFEATARIRTTTTGGKGIPIIAMTANALDGDRERCLQAGMNDYLAKPVSLDAFEAILSRWITTARSNGDQCPSVERLIAQFGGDVRLLNDVTAVFLDDATRLMNSLREALDTDDATKLQRAAHTLKGALGNFGPSSALDLVREIEIAGRTENLPLARSLFAPLTGAAAKLCNSLSTACAALANAS